MELHARAGIDDLGMYLSRGNGKKVSDAIAALSRAVKNVAVDYSMEDALGDLSKGLNPERDNRSVTDPEWVEKGIAAYGCPIHPTTSSGSTSTFPVSGHGECCCRRRSRDVGGNSASYTGHGKPATSQVSTAAGPRGRRGGGDDEQRNSSSEGRTGHVGTGHVSYDPRQLDRRTALANEVYTVRAEPHLVHDPTKPMPTRVPYVRSMTVQVLKREGDSLSQSLKWWRVTSYLTLTLGLLCSLVMNWSWMPGHASLNALLRVAGGLTPMFLAVGFSLALLVQRLGWYGWRRFLRQLWGRATANEK